MSHKNTNKPQTLKYSSIEPLILCSGIEFCTMITDFFKTQWLIKNHHAIHCLLYFTDENTLEIQFIIISMYKMWTWVQGSFRKFELLVLWKNMLGKRCLKKSLKSFSSCFLRPKSMIYNLSVLLFARCWRLKSSFLREKWWTNKIHVKHYGFYTKNGLFGIKQVWYDFIWLDGKDITIL